MVKVTRGRKGENKWRESEVEGVRKEGGEENRAKWIKRKVKKKRKEKREKKNSQ